MPTHATRLYKHCPVCGGISIAEAKLPGSGGPKPAELWLDEIGKLVETQTLGLLLALVEVLPYKRFTCGKCHYEFQLESQSGKDLLHAMLIDMKPVAPPVRPTQAKKRKAPPPPPPAPVAKQPNWPFQPPPDWEPESVD